MAWDWMRVGLGVVVMLAGGPAACGDPTPAMPEQSTDDATSGPSSGGSSAEGSTLDGSSTGAEPSCVAGAGEGRGLAYVGTPEAGVWCVDEVCEHGCDLRFSPSCKPTPEPSIYLQDILCDGPEDCGEGQACCLGVDEHGSSYSRCADEATCLAMGLPTCNDASDCGDGSCVRAIVGGSSHAFAEALDVGSCQDEPTIACMLGPGSDCGGARLSHANLSTLELQGANLCGADLSGAVLIDARLDEASLAGADLTRAHLFRTSLRGADLTDASLRDATMTGADLTGADLTGADLTGAHGDVTCPDGAPSAPFDPLDLDAPLCEGQLEP